MTDNEIVEQQAIDFLENVKSFIHSDNYDYRLFSKRLQDELHLLAFDEHKIVFINRVYEEIVEKVEIHKDECTYEGEGQCPTHKYLFHAKFYVKQEVQKLPQVLRQSVITNKDRTKVFISYSHYDTTWVDKLKRHFRPFKDKIDFWDDSRIKTGDKWKDQIEIALNESKVAILLLSPDFFNSNFVTEVELPKLLRKAEIDGTTIISIILKPCLFEEHSDLSQFQAVNSPKKSIIQMDEADQEITWMTTVRRISEILSNPIN